MSWQMFFRPGNTVVDCIYKCNKQSLRAWDPTKKLKASLLDLYSPRHTLWPVLWWLWSDGQWWRHGCSWGWPLRLARRSARDKGVHASCAGEEDWRGVFRLKKTCKEGQCIFVFFLLWKFQFSPLCKPYKNSNVSIIFVKFIFWFLIECIK